MFWGVALTGMGTVTTRDPNSVLFWCASTLLQDELTSLALIVAPFLHVGLDIHFVLSQSR